MVVITFSLPTKPSTIMQRLPTRPMLLKRDRCMAALSALLVRHYLDYPNPQDQVRSVTTATFLPGRLISWQNGSMRDIERVDRPFVAITISADFLKTTTIESKKGDNDEE